MVEGFKSVSVKDDIFEVTRTFWENLSSEKKGESYSNWFGKKMVQLIRKDDWLQEVYAKHLSFRRIHDNKIEILDDHDGKIVKIEYKDNRTWCNSCDKKNCTHCYYAMALLEIAELQDSEK